MKTSEHEVVFAIVNSGFAEDVMEVAREQGVRGGKGISFAVPLSSVIGVNLYQFLSDNRMGRGV